jgi:hypothetical protein
MVEDRSHRVDPARSADLPAEAPRDRRASGCPFEGWMEFTKNCSNHWTAHRRDPDAQITQQEN